MAHTVRVGCAFVLAWMLHGPALLGPALLGPALLGPAWAADYSERDDVKAYIAELVGEHNFERSALEALFGQAQRKERILEAIARPAERTKPWHEYRDIFVTRSRIAEGIDFWTDNATALERAQQRYSVPPEIIVAIIGVETRYGRMGGSFRVLDALATLAFDYPPRASFFRSELTHLLLLAREENKDPLRLKGSYAGAMGYGQFIPSSFREYAVDFDGDGTRDIWSNTTDAIGSIANYFARHGWRGEGPVALQVDVEGPRALAIANESLKLNYDVAELKQLGVKMPAHRSVAVPDDARAALFRMEGDDGLEYWLALHDFYVITRYNRSRMYALAVLQLGQAISRSVDQVALARR